MRVLGTYNNKENFGDLRDATIAFEFSHPHPLHAYVRETTAPYLLPAAMKYFELR
jgi:hypothetical protein